MNFPNHSQSLRVRSALKAGEGRIVSNHNESMRVRSQLKAGEGRVVANHNESMRVRSQLKAGGRYLNHSEWLRVICRERFRDF